MTIKDNELNTIETAAKFKHEIGKPPAEDSNKTTGVFEAMVSLRYVNMYETCGRITLPEDSTYTSTCIYVSINLLHLFYNENTLKRYLMSKQKK